MKPTQRLVQSSILTVSMLLGSAALGTLVWGADGAAPAGAKAAAPAAGARDDAVGHFRRAKALFDAGKFADAKVENDKALALDPKLLDAQVLGRRIDEAMKSTTPSTAATATGPVEKGDVLTKEQISRIRLFELSDADRRVQGTIARKDLEDFWRDVVLKDPNLSGTPTDQQRNAFMAVGNFVGQALRIRDSREDKYISKVTVTSDPASVLSFRTLVQPYLTQNCGSCHTPEKPNGYPVYGTKGNPSVAETYTNFYVLSTTKVGETPMLNRSSPEDSLFLQYGLPRNLAKFPHPKLDKGEVRQGFSGPQDKRFVQMVAWINGLQRPTPPYGVDFKVPKGTTAATAPK